MSDDIREVMRPTSFSSLKRADRSGRHKDGAQQHSGGWAEEESPQPEAEERDAALETLSREVRDANEQLQKSGKTVRLRLASETGGPVIEVILPDEAGMAVVTQRIAPNEMQAWLLRLETAEGLVIDEKM